MLFDIQRPSITTTINTVASIAASYLLIKSIIDKYISPRFQSYILSKLGSFIGSFFSQVTLVVEDIENPEPNELFKAVDWFLPTIINRDSLVLKVGLAPGQSQISFRIEEYQTTTDTYQGVAYKWEMVPREKHIISSRQRDGWHYKLSFHKKYRNCAIEDYLQHLVDDWRKMERERKTPRLFTLNSSGPGRQWNSVELYHPATFETLAMDSKMKTIIKNDLNNFKKRKEFYKSVGKVWKRGYLLYGPPGTGKSTLVAAIANHLNLDIYDLELPKMWHNSEFRSLALATANKSIILVEDVDRHFERKAAREAAGRYESEDALAELLNFVDGVWSGHGDGRIVVFTANNIDVLDPALLRPGRMDMQIPMSYCTREGFRTLALNYHNYHRRKEHPLEEQLQEDEGERLITKHPLYPLFSEVEQLIEMTKVTPAEICEQLLKDDDPKITLEGLIEFLKEKKNGGESTAGVIVLGPSKAESTPELHGSEGQSKKSQETHEIQLSGD